MAERTSATSVPSSVADIDRRASTIAGSSPARPAATASEAKARVTSEGLAPEEVLDDLLPTVRRQVRVGQGVPQLVVALDGPGDPEELVAPPEDSWPSALATA